MEDIPLVHKLNPANLTVTNQTGFANTASSAAILNTSNTAGPTSTSEATSSDPEAALCSTSASINRVKKKHKSKNRLYSSSKNKLITHRISKIVRRCLITNNNNNNHNKYEYEPINNSFNESQFEYSKKSEITNKCSCCWCCSCCSSCFKNIFSMCYK